jgi:hypothetical protein
LSKVDLAAQVYRSPGWVSIGQFLKVRAYGYGPHLEFRCEFPNNAPGEQAHILIPVNDFSSLAEFFNEASDFCLTLQKPEASQAQKNFQSPIKPRRDG